MLSSNYVVTFIIYFSPKLIFVVTIHYPNYSFLFIIIIFKKIHLVKQVEVHLQK